MPNHDRRRLTRVPLHVSDSVDDVRDIARHLERLDERLREALLRGDVAVDALCSLATAVVAVLYGGTMPPDVRLRLTEAYRDATAVLDEEEEE